MGTKGYVQNYVHMHLCTHRSTHMIMNRYIYASIQNPRS